MRRIVSSCGLSVGTSFSTLPHKGYGFQRKVTEFKRCVGAWRSVCCECCVLSSRGLCDGLITRPEEPYRVWCVVECDRGGPDPLRCVAPKLKIEAISVLVDSALYSSFDLRLGVWSSYFWQSTKAQHFSHITTDNVHLATLCGIP